MELALSVWLFKKKYKNNPKDSLHTTVAKSSAQKEKRKGETQQEKKRFITFKKEKKSNTIPATL